MFIDLSETAQNNRPRLIFLVMHLLVHSYLDFPQESRGTSEVA